MAKLDRLSRFLFGAGVLAALVSLGIGAARGTGPGQERIEGVVPILNPKTPKNPSTRVLFKEDLTIGVKEGDENYMFGERVYFNVDRDGNIFVTDWDRKRIQKFGPDGRYILTIGRKGQGPGEFGNVWEPEFDKDGSLYAVDIAQKRINFFDRDGRYLKEISFPTTQISSSAFLSAGGLFLTMITRFLTEDGTRYDQIFGLFDSEFRPVKILHQQSREHTLFTGQGEDSVAQDWAAIMSKTALKPDVHYLMGPADNVYFGYSKDYEIRVYSPEGKLTRIIRKDYDPAPVTAADKEEYEKLQTAEFLRFMPSQFEGAKKKALRLIRYPEFKPAYQGFVVADNGWIFVIAEVKGNKTVILDIFDDRGIYVARSEATIPTESLRIRNGKAYAIATDEGYKFVKRYDLVITQK